MKENIYREINIIYRLAYFVRAALGIFQTDDKCCIYSLNNNN